MPQPETCSRCGEEVRYGRVDGSAGWFHRDYNADHMPIFGHIQTPEEAAEIERQLDLPRTRTVMRKVDGEAVAVEEAYTVRELELERYRKSKKFRDMEEAAEAVAALESGEPLVEEEIEELPEPEIARHDVTADDFPPRSGIRQIINLIKRTEGWEIYRLTACRGPYIGASGEVLSISDHVVLGARGPAGVDGRRIAVGTWRDGGFDTGYTGILKNGRLETATAKSTDLKDWIKT